MYKSEAAFSHALEGSLKKTGIMIQRLESALTGCGIPDMYVRMKDREIWIELKNIKYDSVHASSWRVPWRKGQQAWAAEYRKISGKYTYTICALQNGYIVIPMTKEFKGNIVTFKDCHCMTKLHDIKEIICLG
jgi:hypothetical protein